MEMLAPIDEALDTVTKQYVDDKLGGTNEVSIQNDTPVDGTELWVDWDDSPVIMVPQAGRNRIINGDFSINQRGWSVASSSTSPYPADRWIFGSLGGTCTLYNSGTNPGDLPESAYNHIAHVISGQSAANHWATGYQRIDDVRVLSGKQVTVSFWATADANQSIGVELYQNFGTGGSAAVYPGTVKVQLSNVWKRYSVTMNLPSLAGKTIGTDSKLVLQFYQSAGSDLAVRSGGIGIQSGTFRFWGVQLEEGPVATPFEFRTTQETLAMCQRYFVRMAADSSALAARFGLGTAPTTTSVNFLVPIPVPMRYRPVTAWGGPLVASDGFAALSISALSTFVITSPAVYGGSSVNLTATVAGATQFRPYWLEAGSGAGAFVDLNAEVP